MLGGTIHANAGGVVAHILVIRAQDDFLELAITVGIADQEVVHPFADISAAPGRTRTLTDDQPSSYCPVGRRRGRRVSANRRAP